jgi:hypothetical protein
MQVRHLHRQASRPSANQIILQTYLAMALLGKQMPMPFPHRLLLLQLQKYLLLSVVRSMYPEM